MITVGIDLGVKSIHNSMWASVGGAVADCQRRSIADWNVLAKTPSEPPLIATSQVIGHKFRGENNNILEMVV